MRPTRLELEGFASFQDRTEVDFGDADLFVLAGSTGAGKCLPGDVPLWHGKTGQRVAIADVVGGRLDSVLGFVGGNIVSVPVVDWHDLGPKPVVRLVLEDGTELRAARSHPVLTSTGMVLAGNLAPGDWVAQAGHLAMPSPRLYTPDEALIVGLLLGDGTIPRDHGPVLHNTDNDIASLYGRAIAAVFPDVQVYRSSSRNIGIRIKNPGRDERAARSAQVAADLEARLHFSLGDVMSTTNAAQIRRGERALPYRVIEMISDVTGEPLDDERRFIWPAIEAHHWLRRMGLAGTTVDDKRVPSDMVLQGGDVAWSLISGLLLTDGWFSPSAAEVGLVSKSEHLARDLRRVARSVGLATTMTQKCIRGTAYHRVLFRAEDVRRMAGCLTLVGRKAEAFDDVVRRFETPARRIHHDRIPPDFNRHLQRSGRYGWQRLESQSLDRQTYLELGGDPDVAAAEILWTKVRAVHDDGEQANCYDITVDTDEHLYVADQVVVHNSSVIDAIVFSLYGIVPRYDDRRLVEPVISKGRTEARVRLDFTIGGVAHSAVRVVRRLPNGGATTKEARLERWVTADGAETVVLADGAGELTAAVERLLGLTYDHFTTCVVLPQGAFSEFLHAKPKARRELLVDLLDLGVYAKVGQAARTAATAAETQAQTLAEQLDGTLAEATPGALDAARRRAHDLGGLLATVDERQPALDELLEEGSRQATKAKELEARRAQLVALAVPDDVSALATSRADAATAVAEAEQAVVRAGEAVEAAQQEQAAAVDRGPLTEATELLVRRTRLTAALADATKARDAAETEVTRADEARTQADDAVTAAQEHLDHARRDDLVVAVTSGLELGDPCPVCDQPLTALPDAEGSAVPVAEEALRTATTTQRAAAAASDSAGGQLARATANLASMTDQATDVDQRLAALAEAGHPVEPEAVQAATSRLDELAAAVTTRRKEEATAREGRRLAEQARDAADRALRAAWAQFDQARDALAVLDPPSRVDDDLAASWQELATWADGRAPELAAEADQAEAEVGRTREAYRSAVAELRAACDAAEVTVGEGERPRDAVLQARERARTRVEQLEESVARATDVRKQLTEARERSQVASMLGTHLKSDRFQEWLVRRALHHLVAGATTDLRAMTDGAYSLVLDDDGDFAVIDHRNTDELRPARTLSGGETFLASLALALALSQQVAELAAQGAARLEALFLDEGFGTLDAETLGVVADALEELGSRGRMVGVITHVPELAARLPVRFDVRKLGSSSTIERADGARVDAP